MIHKTRKPKISNQSYDASEPSYTLDVDQGIADKED